MKTGSKGVVIKRNLLVGFLGCALAAPLSWAGGPVSSLIVFGDSLSDTGNAFALQKVNTTPPNYSGDPLLIPDDAYARGGHHFSNGPTWAEDYAKPRGLIQDVSAAFQDGNPRATNYAVGGARAFDDMTGTNVNLPLQVQIFLKDFGGNAPPDALYVIEIGGNDIRDALAVTLGGGDPSLVIGAGLTSVYKNIEALYQAGARKFLVWNAPDLGLTPAVHRLELVIPGAVAGASAASQAYNAGLDGALATLRFFHPDINIREFDLFRTLNDLVKNPSTYGLTDVTDPCISPNDPPFVCTNPDGYLFWDGIHPTKAAHAILSQEVAEVLK